MFPTQYQRIGPLVLEKKSFQGFFFIIYGHGSHREFRIITILAFCFVPPTHICAM